MHAPPDLLVEPGDLVLNELRRDEASLADAFDDLLRLLLLLGERSLDVAAVRMGGGGLVSVVSHHAAHAQMLT